MTERRRERMTLEALQDVVRWLPTIREERKAIVSRHAGMAALSARPDDAGDQGNGAPEQAPRRTDGALTTENRTTPSTCRKPSATPTGQAGRDRQRPAAEGSHRRRESGQRQFLHDRPRRTPGVAADRSNAMRTLADNTDGLALLNSNDLDKAWRRIADDQSSIPTCSATTRRTRSPTDGIARSRQSETPGRERSRPARYRAPTVEEVTLARRDPPAAVPEAPGAAMAARAVATLAEIRPDSRFAVNAAVRRGRAAHLGRGRTIAGPGAARRVHARRVNSSGRPRQAIVSRDPDRAAQAAPPRR